MTRLHRTGLLVAGLLGVLAPSAGALTISPNPLVLAGNGAPFQLVSAVTGVPAGGVVSDGSVGAGDVSLVFQAGGSDIVPYFTIILSVDSGSGLLAPTAIGWIPGVEPDGLVDVTPSFLGVDEAGFTPAESMNGGELTDLFFVSYAAIPDDGSHTLEVLTDGGFGTAAFVPEPSTLTLCALGLLGLGVRATRSGLR